MVLRNGGTGGIEACETISVKGGRGRTSRVDNAFERDGRTDHGKGQVEVFYLLPRSCCFPLSPIHTGGSGQVLSCGV